VIPLAPGPARTPPAAAERARVRARYGLDGRYLLFVGLLEPKKNLPVLLEAVARLRARRRFGATRLVLVGDSGWGSVDLPALAARLELGDDVRFLGPAPDEDLGALYAEAEAFVFPSLWEGFGLPVLEALALGTPVLASTRGALPEIAGDAALLVEPEVGALAEGLDQLLEDASLRARLREAGPRRAARFSWERTARETLEAYHDVGRAP
jgi:glycosyltransferase involved in cell wall biosynthesis